MASKHRLEEAFAALTSVIEQINEFEKNYGDILNEYRKDRGIITEEDRADAAIKMIHKYSNL